MFTQKNIPDSANITVNAAVTADAIQVKRPKIIARASKTSTIDMNFCMNNATSRFGIMNLKIGSIQCGTFSSTGIGSVP